MKRLYGILALTVMGLSHCGQQVAGTGTETSAGGGELGKVRGTVMTTTGHPAESTEVTVVPVRYNPILDNALPDSFTVETDVAGSYAIAGLVPGTYNILARGHRDATLMLQRDVTVDAGATTEAGARKLSAPGSVEIKLRGSTGLAGSHLYVEGTTLTGTVDSVLLAQGLVRFDSLPVGISPPLAAVYRTVSARMGAEVPVSSGVTTAVQAGRTVRVALTGDDDNDGTIFPLRTVARGCMLVSAGDTLLIENGEYNDNWPLERLVGGGLVDAPIVIRGAGSQGAVLRGQRDPDSSFAIWEGLVIDRAAHVIVEDMVFADFLHGIRVSNAANIAVRRCSFVNNGYVGFKVSSSRAILVTGSRFVDTMGVPPGAVQDYGVQLDTVIDVRLDTCVFFGGHDVAGIRLNHGCARVTVANSVIEGVRGDGIQIGPDRGIPASNTDITVESCVFRPALGRPLSNALLVQNVSGFTCRANYFEGSATGGGTLESEAIALKEDPSGIVTVVRNVFAFFPDVTALRIQSYAPAAARFYNNTFHRCDRPMAFVNRSPLDFKNNILSLCAPDSMGTGNFRGDPLFAGPLTAPVLSAQAPAPQTNISYYGALVAPYALQAGSPAIDAGADVGLPYVGSAPDMGAFEKEP